MFPWLEFSASRFADQCSRSAITAHSDHLSRETRLITQRTADVDERECRQEERCGLWYPKDQAINDSGGRLIVAVRQSS